MFGNRSALRTYAIRIALRGQCDRRGDSGRPVGQCLDNLRGIGSERVTLVGIVWLNEMRRNAHGIPALLGRRGNAAGAKPSPSTCKAVFRSRFRNIYGLGNSDGTPSPVPDRLVAD